MKGTTEVSYARESGTFGSYNIGSELKHTKSILVRKICKDEAKQQISTTIDLWNKVPKRPPRCCNHALPQPLMSSCNHFTTCYWYFVCGSKGWTPPPLVSPGPQLAPKGNSSRNNPWPNRPQFHPPCHTTTIFFTIIHSTTITTISRSKNTCCLHSFPPLYMTSPPSPHSAHVCTWGAQCCGCPAPTPMHKAILMPPHCGPSYHPA